MNKTPFLIIVILVNGLLVHAQDTASGEKEISKIHRFSVKIGAGNAFPLSGDAANSSSALSNNASNNTQTSTFDAKRSSHFSGWNGTIGGAYMFSRYLGVACDASIMLTPGKNSNSFANDHAYFDSLNNAWSKSSSKETWKSGSTVLLMPCLLLQNDGKHIDFYSRIGVVLPIVNKISDSYEETANTGIVARSYEYKTRFTIGYTGAIGLKYKINQCLQVWGELNFISFAPFIKERTITKSTLNGVDGLSAYLPQEKKTEYALSGSSPTNVYPRNYELTRPASSLSYSNAGIQFGLAMRFGNDPIVMQEAKMPKKKKVYFKLGMGYGLPVQSASSGKFAMAGTQTDDFNYSKSISATSFKFKPFSFTSGFSGTAGAGYMLTRHIGIELDANMGLSAERNVWTANTKNYPNGTGTYDGYSAFSYAQAKTPVLLMPSIVFQTGGELLNVYTRLGVVMPLKDKVTEETGEEQSSTRIYTIKYEYSTKFTLGYNGAAGLSYNIGKHLQIWGELNMVSFAPFLKEQKTSSYIVNGVSILSRYPKGLQATEYNFSGATTWGQNGPLAQRQEATFSLPFGNVGMNVGVSFHL